MQGLKAFRLVECQTKREPVLADSKSCFGHGVNRAGAKFFAFVSHSI